MATFSKLSHLSSDKDKKRKVHTMMISTLQDGLQILVEALPASLLIVGARMNISFLSQSEDSRAAWMVI